MRSFGSHESRIQGWASEESPAEKRIATSQRDEPRPLLHRVLVLSCCSLGLAFCLAAVGCSQSTVAAPRSTGSGVIPSDGDGGDTTDGGDDGDGGDTDDNTGAGELSLSNSSLDFAGGTLVAGTSFDLKLTVRDGVDAIIDDGTLEVTFAFVDGTSVVVFSDVSYLGAGIFSVEIAGISAGTEGTIEARIGGELITGVLPQLSVS